MERIITKANGAKRMLMIATLSKVLPLYIVAEYPRSGGSWVSQMLSDYFGVPFPRNKFPKFESCIIHGHYLYNPLFRNVFAIVRDGRDIMVSAYYHFLFLNDRNSSIGVEKHRQGVPFTDYENIEKNLPLFIEYLFTKANQGLFKFTWSEFVNSWENRGVPIIKYEDLLNDAAGVLSTAIRQIINDEPDILKLREIVDQHSFQKIAKRKPGMEDTKSFLRKGIAGDWKNKFNEKSRKIFDYYAGETLITLGYEENRDWVLRDDRSSILM